MKGEPAREDKLNFLIRGGLFAYFLTKQKVGKDFCRKQLLLSKNKLSLRAKSNKVPLEVKKF